MTEQTDNGPTRSLQPRYEDALAASGLVDNVIDIMALDPRPFRYTEGDFVCRHGDAPESLWVIVAGSVSVRDDSRTLFVRHPYDVVGEQNDILVIDRHHSVSHSLQHSGQPVA